MNSAKMDRLYAIVLLLAAMPATAQEKGYEPLPERVNIQADSARMSQVIDGEWVAVGIRKPEALGRDHTRMYAGKPSYRFTLGRDDNTLEGYAPGETKGRSELSWCYATAADFAALPDKTYKPSTTTAKASVRRARRGATPFRSGFPRS